MTILLSWLLIMLCLQLYLLKCVLLLGQIAVNPPVCCMLIIVVRPIGLIDLFAQVPVRGDQSDLVVASLKDKPAAPHLGIQERFVGPASHGAGPRMRSCL
jgi:hypothetical protein